MKNLIKITLLMLLATPAAQAQQDPMLTQYMFNGMYINPAYAGSHDYWTSTFTYRTQWVGGFDGAGPQTAVAAVDGPIRGKNMGLGFVLSYDQLGISRTTTAMANYAYQIRLDDHQRIALGIDAGVAQYDARFNDEDFTVWDTDDNMYSTNMSKLLPKIGTGIYYYGDKHYVGVSIPSLLAYDDAKDFSVDISKSSFLRRHYMIHGGVVIDVAENVKFKPSLLVKYVKNAPIEGDLNFSAIFKDQFWLGATYRTNDAVAIILEYQSNSYFRIGYSYDITTSGLRGYQNGSHEIMIGVDFGKDLIKIKTPRYF